ncbi:MAG: SRPBCC family protein [Candidatus Ranarchaeia archaeon]
MMGKNIPGFTKTVLIYVSIHEVFELLCDLPRLGECMELIERVDIISERKQGVGVRAIWNKKKIGDKKAVSWIEEITEYEPPTKISFATVEGSRRIRGTLTLNAVGKNATKLVFHEEFLYPNPDLAVHKMGMENQLLSMKRCLEGP